MLHLVTIIFSQQLGANDSKACSDAIVAVTKCSNSIPLREASGAFSGPDEVNPSSFSKERCTTCSTQVSTYFTACFSGSALQYMQNANTLLCTQTNGNYCASTFNGTTLPAFDCNSACDVKWASQLNQVQTQWVAAGMSLNDDAKSKLTPTGWTPAEVDSKCGKGYIEKNSASILYSLPLYYISFQ